MKYEGAMCVEDARSSFRAMSTAPRVTRDSCQSRCSEDLLITGGRVVDGIARQRSPQTSACPVRASRASAISARRRPRPCRRARLHRHARAGASLRCAWRRRLHQTDQSSVCRGCRGTCSVSPSAPPQTVPLPACLGCSLANRAPPRRRAQSRPFHCRLGNS